MGASTPRTIEELRRDVWPRVAHETRLRIDELGRALQQVAALDDTDRSRDAAVRAAHSIAGTTGVYGLDDAARIARRIEQLLRGHDDAREAASIAALQLRSLREACMDVAP